MADFRAATESELRALRAMTAGRRILRRLEVRLAIKRARIRVARTLKAVRSMRRVTDVRWHAQITAAEARALESLAMGMSARRVMTKLLARTARRLQGSGTGR